MTSYERSRRADRRKCRLVGACAVLALVAAVALPLVALAVGYVTLAGVAWLAASAFRV